MYWYSLFFKLSPEAFMALFGYFFEVDVIVLLHFYCILLSAFEPWCYGVFAFEAIILVLL